MKWLIILFLFLNFSMCFGQKSYEFDTLLEYDCRFNTSKSDTTIIQYLYTNSKNNSYYILVRKYDSLYYSLEFIAQDKYYSKVKVDKNKLFKSADIEISDCSSINKMSNNYKFRIKEYDFVNLKDTLINNELHKYYKLKYLKSKKKKKRKSIGTNYYIIKNKTENHLPILKHSTAFEEWKKERNIPNGIYQEFIFYDQNEKIVNHYKLKKLKRIAIKLNMVEPCPPTMIIQQ